MKFFHDNISFQSRDVMKESFIEFLCGRRFGYVRDLHFFEETWCIEWQVDDSLLIHFNIRIHYFEPFAFSFMRVDRDFALLFLPDFTSNRMGMPSNSVTKSISKVLFGFE